MRDRIHDQAVEAIKIKAMKKSVFFLILSLVLSVSSCGSGKGTDLREWDKTIYSPRFASGFRIMGKDGSESRIIFSSKLWQGSEGKEQMIFISRNGEKAPKGFNGSVINGDAQRIVCMSSTYIAMLDFIGEAGRIAGVSGIDYISNSYVQANRDRIADIGYDGNADYEMLVAIRPDIVLLYGISSASPMETKLKELKIPYFYIGDYLEESPLGKAEWSMVISEICGALEKGKELFAPIPARYDSLRNLAAGMERKPSVMVNAPYGDSWIMSPSNSYMGRLISDAGGKYIYEDNGTDKSMTIDIEQAYKYVCECDLWINAGNFTSMKELAAALPRFTLSNVVLKGNVFTNNRRITAAGGNDFWESGIVHPDIILEDLIKIFHPGTLEGDLTYYRRLE